MRYRIAHRTEYQYTGPVHESFNEIRLRPCSDEQQLCLNFGLEIDPPATVIVFTDYYGNTVHDFSVPYLHSRLTIEATSDVVTFAAEDEPLAGPRDGQVDHSPTIASLAVNVGFADDFVEFLAPSTYVALEDESAAISRRILEQDGDISAYGFLCACASTVRAMLQYQVGATNVHSKVAEILAGGSGVCQDFSHVLISLCRHAGLPARYVSGYLGNVAESEASHAWVEAYVPPYGWVGFDATSGGPCTGRHVKISVGRDYADVTVVRGTYRGGVANNLAVTVRSETVGSGQNFAMRPPERRSELVQYQAIGAMRQLQRLGAMTQSMDNVSPAIGALLDIPATMRLPGADEEIPRQQPQQQQQYHCVPEQA
ncbi:MAG: transglutaminase family protein [Thermomicrobiales bacterium]